VPIGGGTSDAGAHSSSSPNNSSDAGTLPSNGSSSTNLPSAGPPPKQDGGCSVANNGAAGSTGITLLGLALAWLASRRRAR
jgi:MYXO-CTERM domain-containing protein